MRYFSAVSCSHRVWMAPRWPQYNGIKTYSARSEFGRSLFSLNELEQHTSIEELL